MPVYNGLEFTKKALENLYNSIGNIDQESLAIGIIVVNDGSTDGTTEYITRTYADCIVLEGDGNLWWSGAMNVGARYACQEFRADYIALWNNDILCDHDFFGILKCILEHCSNNDIIGAKIYAKSNLVWSMGGLFNPYSGKKTQLGSFATDSTEFESITMVDWLPGMGTIIHTDVIRKIGYWDALSFPQYHGDSDFTYRAKLAGFNIMVYPQLKLWNDVSNTGIEHKGSFKTLLHSLNHTKSYNNIHFDLKFYKKYAQSPVAYIELINKYFRLFGGFFKWKIINAFRAIFNSRQGC